MLGCRQGWSAAEHTIQRRKTRPTSENKISGQEQGLRRETRSTAGNNVCLQQKTRLATDNKVSNRKQVHRKGNNASGPGKTSMQLPKVANEAMLKIADTAKVMRHCLTTVSGQ